MQFVHCLEYDDIDQNGEKNDYANQTFPSNNERTSNRSDLPSHDSYVKLPYEAFQENAYIQLQDSSPVSNTLSNVLLRSYLFAPWTCVTFTAFETVIFHK